MEELSKTILARVRGYLVFACTASAEILSYSEILDGLQHKRWSVGYPVFHLPYLADFGEVVTLLITNTDGMPPTTFDGVFKAASLDTMSWTPPSAQLNSTAWPTLGSLIDGGTRLVTFLAQQADFTQVPYLIDGSSPPYFWPCPQRHAVLTLAFPTQI